MNFKEQYTAETARWRDQDKPKVWYQIGEQDWDLAHFDINKMGEYLFIVDDKHAELRKKLIENPKLRLVEILDDGTTECLDYWFLDLDINKDYEIDSMLLPDTGPEEGYSMIDKDVNTETPYHYSMAGLETMPMIEAILDSMVITPHQGFLLGNILKYRLRLGKKDDIFKDLDKANHYEKMLADSLNG